METIIMKTSKRVCSIVLLALSLALFSCQTKTPTQEDPKVEYLKSWNEGLSKQNIIHFVEDITDEASIHFIAAEDRIATFDNDGNLWAEQPYYFQLEYALDQMQKLAPLHPEWKKDALFSAALKKDIPEVLKFGEEGLLKIIMETHTGMTSQEFEAQVVEWINTAKHPKTKQFYKDMVYQPMLELLDFLRAHDFKLFIVSGGGVDFMRAWAPEVYGIPKDRIIGSSLKSEFLMTDQGAKIIKVAEIDVINDKKGKPLGINRHIGSVPLFASGNSDGDLPMMQYTASGQGKRFMLYLHHTDAEREWAYDRESHIGRLDKGLEEAQTKGWTVIDMKRDWKVIYPFELTK